MTLILTTVRPADVLITSDGRSVETKDGRITAVQDDRQKIFPVPDHALAIAHHGENMLDGKPVGQWIVDLFRRINFGNLSIEEIADELRARLHALVRKRLRSINGVNGFGMLVIGFGARQQRPSLVEIFWKQEKNNLTTAEQAMHPITICTSGSGASQIPKADWHEVADKSTPEFRAYHKKLMDAAIAAKPDANTVGGHVHELMITPQGWKWMIEPKAK